MKKKKGKGRRVDLRLLAVLPVTVETIRRWFQAAMKQAIVAAIFSFCAEALFSSLFFKIVTVQPARGRRWREADSEVVDGASQGGGVASNGGERDQKRKRLLFFSSPLFSCFSVLFLCSNLPFSIRFLCSYNPFSILFCFQLLWFSNRCTPLFFFPTVKCLLVPSVFFLNLHYVFLLFFLLFLFSILFSLLFLYFAPPPTNYSLSIVFTGKKIGREVYYPCLIMAQG